MTTMNSFLSGLRSSALVVANDRRLLDCRDIGLPSDRPFTKPEAFGKVTEQAPAKKRPCIYFLWL